ncbi:unnamed protein product [Peniophora sp. CBMAI 1063]|nr:unnamed protein product [Peniophora sp. CBMAI 1063]
MRLRDLFRRRIESRAVTGAPPLNSTDYTCNLPDDVVYELFEAAALIYPPSVLVMTPTSAQTLRGTHSLLGWVILTHICRRWRHIGLSATLAPLWARIVCLSWKPNVALELSERARGCPITIDFSRHNGQFGRERRELSSLEDWTYRNIGRTVALISPGQALVNKLKSQKLVLPNLREVRLSASDLPWNFAITAQWELSGLQRAWLNMALLPSSMVATVRELHLRIYASHTPLTELHEVLRACVLLEHLDISVHGGWSHKDLPDNAVEREARKGFIIFDGLKTAEVKVSADSILTDLWSPIRCPPTLTLQVKCATNFWSGPLPRVEGLLEACRSQTGSTLYDGVDLHMPEGNMRRSSMRLHLSSSSSSASCELSFLSDKTSRLQMLLALPAYISGASITQLTLGGSPTAADLADADEAICVLGGAL